MAPVLLERDQQPHQQKACRTEILNHLFRVQVLPSGFAGAKKSSPRQPSASLVGSPAALWQSLDLGQKEKGPFLGLGHPVFPGPADSIADMRAILPAGFG